MNYSKFQLRDLLKLDSIYHVLTLTERVTLHAHILHQPNAPQLNLKIIKYLNLIDETNWEAPELRFGQDRLQYYKNPMDRLIPIENYPIHNPATTQKVNRIKLKYRTR